MTTPASRGRADRCSKTIHVPIGNGYSNMQPCSRVARMTAEDGKRYCNQHDPEKVKARTAARDAAYKAKWAKQDARYAREAACIAACAGVPTEKLTLGILAAKLAEPKK